MEVLIRKTARLTIYNGWKQIASGALNYSNPENPPGGNALFVYPCSKPLQFPKWQHTINISHCEFAHGIDTTSLEFERWHESFHKISGGSGLGILFYCRTASYHEVSYSIADSTFHHNESPYGPGANVLLLFDITSTDLMTDEMIRIDIFMNRCKFHDGEALDGGGIFVGHIGSGSTYPLIRVSNSTLSHNIARSGGGLHFISKLGEYMHQSPKGRDYLSLINFKFSCKTEL